jgi:hypothetical protein
MKTKLLFGSSEPKWHFNCQNRNDKEIVETAVNQNGLALEFVGEELKITRKS